MRTWARTPAALWRRSGPRAIVVLPDGDDAILLEGAAAVLWMRLDSPLRTSDLQDLLPLDPASAAPPTENEVVGLLLELESLGALVQQ